MLINKSDIFDAKFSLSFQDPLIIILISISLSYSLSESKKGELWKWIILGRRMDMETGVEKAAENS